MIGGRGGTEESSPPGKYGQPLSVSLAAQQVRLGSHTSTALSPVEAGAGSKPVLRPSSSGVQWTVGNEFGQKAAFS